jgi:hypothetical protein
MAIQPNFGQKKGHAGFYPNENLAEGQMRSRQKLTMKVKAR